MKIVCIASELIHILCSHTEVHQLQFASNAFSVNLVSKVV